MVLLFALLLPFAVSFVAYLISGKKITPKELAIQLAGIALAIGGMYAIMMSGRTSDTELLNGSIAEKSTGHTGCCHSYQCHCHQVCSGSGSGRSCSEECDTCYEHSHDVYWEASSTTGARVYYDTCNAPHAQMPARWGVIYPGEPTAQEHDFMNYIKGNPNSILRRGAVSDRLLAQVPEYPVVFDYYRARRFIDLGVKGVDVQALNHELDFVNAQLGAKRQVNIIVVVTKEADPIFAEALRQKWLGGKKNDVVVIIGTPAFPAISWVDTVSWTQQEAMKIRIRDNVLAMGNFDGRRVIGIVAFEVDQGFRRRHMRDFKYLSAGIEPGTGATVALLVVALLLSVGWSVVSYRNDLFGEEPRPRRFY